MFDSSKPKAIYFYDVLGEFESSDQAIEAGIKQLEEQYECEMRWYDKPMLAFDTDEEIEEQEKLYDIKRKAA